MVRGKMEQHSSCAGEVVGSLACGSVEVASAACGGVACAACGGVASAACGAAEVAGTEKDHRRREKNKYFNSPQTKDDASFQSSAMQFHRSDQHVIHWPVAKCYLLYGESTFECLFL